MGGHWPLKFLPDFPLHSVGNGLDRSVALDYHPCERLFSGSGTVKTVPYNFYNVCVNPFPTIQLLTPPS